MNWKLSILPLLTFATICLPSCSSGGPGGAVIHDPSAEEVARMEAQWGLTPRVIKPRLRPMEPGDMPMNTTPTPTPVYTPDPEPTLAPAPAPVLQEPAQAPAPAPIDPATIQKLR
jgi:hypothetical protein